MKSTKVPTKVPIRYLPSKLSKKDKNKQIAMLFKSKRLYKQNKYYTRKTLSSHKNKPSSHIQNAKKIYDIDTLSPSKDLVAKTGCSISALKQIIKKGEGAYFSSGSRPNQTAQSWGYARLASALTSGKAGAIDYDILNDGCKRGSKGYKMAQLARKKYGYGKRKVSKVKII